MSLTVRSTGVVLSSVTAVAALSALGLTGAVAAAPATRAAWPAQVTRPGAATCPHGDTLIKPTSGWTDVHGVAHIAFQSAPGIVANIPPRGLTARQVTPAVMADLGMHGRGVAGSSERRKVAMILRLSKDRTAPEFCRSGHEPVLGHVYKGNWAGYAVTEAEFGGSINGVTGSWTVPQSMTVNSTPNGEATWVGIGGGLGEGSSTWGLIQAGTEMQTGDGYRTVWEYIGSSGCVTTFCGQYSSVNAVRPGVTVNTDVWWDTSSTATFLVQTSSGGGSWDITDHSVNIPYDHTSAEWINEWPDFPFYDNPGTVHWGGQGLTGAFGGQGSLVPPFAGSFEAVIMAIGKTSATSCGSNNNVLSYPTAAANTSGGGTSQIVTCTIQGVDAP